MNIFIFPAEITVWHMHVRYLTRRIYPKLYRSLHNTWLILYVHIVQYIYEYKYVFIYIVVNKQTESHKVFIFYLHEAELLYNDVHHSQLTL